MKAEALRRYAVHHSASFHRHRAALESNLGKDAPPEDASKSAEDEMEESIYGTPDLEEELLDFLEDEDEDESPHFPQDDLGLSQDLGSSAVPAESAQEQPTHEIQDQTGSQEHLRQSAENASGQDQLQLAQSSEEDALPFKPTQSSLAGSIRSDHSRQSQQYGRTSDQSPQDQSSHSAEQSQQDDQSKYDHLKQSPHQESPPVGDPSQRSGLSPHDTTAPEDLNFIQGSPHGSSHSSLSSVSHLDGFLQEPHEMTRATPVIGRLLHRIRLLSFLFSLLCSLRKDSSVSDTL